MIVRDNKKLLSRRALKAKLDMETKVKYIVGNLLIQEPILL